ncbi:MULTISPECIES: polymorphic toxin type 34 domain-containing protein [unclassified Microcoleus]|uniref:polymorphic toxin type 34 domain-containing protein n=1 Tax=unclassified Microcoleus TaxID=2642155 RepID=UPI002FD13CCA
MTAEGNVADTGIVEEAKQLIAEKEASDMPEALEILKQQAKRDNDKEKKEKIKTTQKAFGGRHSRYSGKKKKTTR